MRPRARRASRVALAGALGVAGANLWVIVAARAHMLPLGATPAPRETALILGARVFVDGELSAVLEDRVLTGIDLHRAGRVKKLLLTGDHGTRGYDEVNAMRRYVIAAGIPPEDVFMDHAGFDTYDSLYRAREVFGVTGVIVVTQAFHLPRAVYTARQLGLDAVGVRADRRPYLGAVAMQGRELASRIKALLELHVLHARPRHLGARIPIAGDGRETWDIARTIPGAR